MNKVDEYSLERIRKQATELTELIEKHDGLPKHLVAERIQILWRTALLYCPDEMGAVMAVQARRPDNRNSFGFCGNADCDNRVAGQNIYCSTCQPKMEAFFKSIDEDLENQKMKGE